MINDNIFTACTYSLKGEKKIKKNKEFQWFIFITLSRPGAQILTLPFQGI